MVKKETLEQLGKLFGITNLAEAITSDKEEEITVPEVHVFTNEELEQRDSNTKSAGYNEGKTAGEDMTVKQIKRDYGLDSVQGKDIKNVMDAYRDKINADASREPNKQVEELTAQITTLQGTVQTLEQEKQQALDNNSKMQLNNKLYMDMPEGLPVSKNEYMAVLSANGVDFESHEGAIVVKRNGNVERDSKTGSPIQPKDFMASFAKDKWGDMNNNTISGRGGESTKHKPNTVKSAKKVAEEWEAEGKSVNSSEYHKHLNKVAKEVEEAGDTFSWDN